MSKEIRIVVDHNDVRRNLLWISLQDDGSLSVGFLGARIIATSFTSERELEDGTRSVQDVDLQATHTPQAMTDPHFTVHPPYFQLRSGKNRQLLAGLVWTTPGPGETTSPWIRFVSNPVRELPIMTPIRPTRETVIQPVLADSDSTSLAVNFDFVDERAAGFPLVVERKAKIITWHSISLLTYARPVPAQPAALGYLIRG
jgi:hypothetical protein